MMDAVDVKHNTVLLLISESTGGVNGRAIQAAFAINFLGPCAAARGNAKSSRNV